MAKKIALPVKSLFEHSNVKMDNAKKDMGSVDGFGQGVKLFCVEWSQSAQEVFDPLYGVVYLMQG